MLASIEQGDMLEAQINLEKALREDSVELLLDLAGELLILGYLVESKKIYEDLYQKYPDVDELKIPLAEIAIEEDQLDQAFVYLESILPDSVFYPHSLLVQADLYQLLNIPEVTEQKLQELIQLLPDEIIPRFAQAEYFYVSGQLEEALKIYELLLDQGETEINHILLTERIGVCLALLGEFEESILYLEKALEKEVTDERLYQLALVYAQLEENQKAMALLQQLKELNPQFAKTYHPLAELLKKENKIEEAFEISLLGIHENPYQLLLYHLAAELAYHLRKIDEAEELLRKAIRLDEDREFSLLKLSDFLMLEERYEDVLDVLVELKETDNPMIFWNLAHTYQKLEDYASAQKYYQQAASQLLHEPDFLKEYALFLREEGQKVKSERLFRSYLELVPDDIDIISLLEND